MNLRSLFAAATAFPLVLVAEPGPEIFGAQDARVHDPSMILKEDDRYWVFSTGHGIHSHSSTDLEEWERGPRVLSQPLPWFKEVAENQRGHLWAPDVIKSGDRYLLYYSVSAFGKQTSAIALATTPVLNPDHPKHHWIDRGIVIRSQPGDPYNAIDPCLFQDGDRLWMAFGSFWKGLYLFELDPESGMRKDPDKKPVHLAAAPEIEAPYLHKRGDYYYLFLNWGKCCRGARSTYEIRVGRSKKVTGPYLDRDGDDLRQGGGTLVLESHGDFVGPGHASIVKDADGNEKLGCHYYDASQRGRSYLALAPLQWTKDGWPEVALPKEDD